jgi:hypothetical protein
VTGVPTNAIFRVEGNHVTTSPLAGGPWDPRAQHGSPPAALVAWVADNLPAPAPMQVARLTVNLMRPVPVGPLSFKSEIIRDGRKIQLSMVQLFADGAEVVRGEVLRIRTHANAVPEVAQTPPLDVPGPELCDEDVADPSRNMFLGAMTMRPAFGRFIQQGPAAIWFRANVPLIEGEPLSPLQRAVMAADFCNGVSPMLDFSTWSFINADLTVNLARSPVGDWILVNAESYSGPTGTGLSIARLADAHGYFGRAIQTLVVEPRGARAG